jgi:hypothetical protein
VNVVVEKPLVSQVHQHILSADTKAHLGEGKQSRRPRMISSRASGRTGNQKGEQLRKITDTAPDEKTNNKQTRQRRSAQDRQTARLAECAEEGTHAALRRREWSRGAT